jgi:hypothetical protein
MRGVRAQGAAFLHETRPLWLADVREVAQDALDGLLP